MKAPFDVRKTAALGLVALGALMAGRGCGGVTDERVQARNQATQATCMSYMRCNQIGPASTDAYADYSSCVTVWQGNWESAWDAADCEGKIDKTNLDVCISAIEGVGCTNGLDILDTLYVKCGKATVCDVGAPADAAAD